MALTEQRVLRSITIKEDIGIAEVRWDDQILRDEEVISNIPFRKTYSIAEKDAFLTEIDSAPVYLAALGWE